MQITTGYMPSHTRPRHPYRLGFQDITADMHLFLDTVSAAFADTCVIGPTGLSSETDHYVYLHFTTEKARSEFVGFLTRSAKALDDLPLNQLTELAKTGGSDGSYKRKL